MKLARRVTHPNVARTFELGSADGVMFCTMELIDGESLTRRLRDRHSLQLSEAVGIAIVVCEALAAAHAVGVIHRDIKPDNVLLAGGRSRRRRRLRRRRGQRRPRARDPSGTPAYMAPEQALGEPPTPAVDVYAVGVVLYEMLTGHRAFAGDVAKILADKQSIERVTVPPGSRDAARARRGDRARDCTRSRATLRDRRRAATRARTMGSSRPRADAASTCSRREIPSGHDGRRARRPWVDEPAVAISPRACTTRS